MTRNFGVLASVVLTLGFVAYACTSGEVVDGPLTGAAGSSSQGTAGTGSGVAGTTGTAGSVTSRGGTTGTAGTIGTAGTVGTAGTTGTAGVAGTAGSTGTTCGTTFDASADGFVRAPAAGGGCWHGYAFAGGDTGSTITPATFMTCGTPCMLHMMGTVGPATMANNYIGVGYLGFNLAQENGVSTKGTVTPTGSGVTVTFTATTGTNPLRAQISSGSTFWCYTITGASPVTIPYASFNTMCWDTTATGAAAYAKTAIDNFELVVPGGAAGMAANVTLVSVKENP